MSPIPKSYDIYKHFKGNLYQVLSVAEHHQTRELLVIYQALYGNFRIYARPLDDFLDKVDKDKYPEAKQLFRFELQMVEAVAEKAFKVMNEPEVEELNIDPMVLQFLDADTHEERINILTGLKHRITDGMITTMAIASDVEVPGGSLEERFLELKNCLITRDKYERSRNR